MLASNTNLAGQEALFADKSQKVQDLYRFLVDELNKIGPVQEIKKALSISFENRRPFASALIRNRSIKLVLRSQHRIVNPRILNIERLLSHRYDHTVLLDSKNDVDSELMGWLEDAYHASD